MERISDYGAYTDGMRKSMADKAWFLDKIDGANVIVDYGCADGALLQYISDAMPRVFELAGIDIDEEMLKLASTNLSINCNQPVCLYNTAEFNLYFAEDINRVCLNCGSVIHEVYSYGTPESIEEFWNFAFSSGFRYIAIRDMGMSKVDISQSQSVFDNAFEKIIYRNRTSDEETDRFVEFLEQIYGDDIVSWRDIVHYLLKYRYVSNWSREVKENYLPLLTEEILLKIPSSYRVKYYDHYTLPFLKDQVMKDFGIELNTKTHYKLLLERID